MALPLLLARLWSRPEHPVTAIPVARALTPAELLTHRIDQVERLRARLASSLRDHDRCTVRSGRLLARMRRAAAALHDALEAIERHAAGR